jgi:uncharacterized damage-inducible protein DinB
MSMNLVNQRDDLLAAFSKSMQFFLAEAELFPRELVKKRPAHKRNSKKPFTACEIVFHMIDVERLWQFRITGLIDGSLKQFQQMDPDKEAADKRYNAKQYNRGIRELASSRSETSRLIRGMTNDQLSLTGIHSKYGEMDTLRILSIMEGHDRQHAAQLERTLAQILSDS